MPQGIPADRILVVEGDFDKMELILDKYGIKYTLLPRERLLQKKFPRAQLLCLNCSRKPGADKAKLVATVKDFVERGGWLITSDWALDPYLTEGFPGKVRRLEMKRHQPDTTVAVSAATLTSPLLQGVFGRGAATQWWLEETSTLFRPEAGVDVLVTSSQLEQGWGASAVVIEFRAGSGRVLHLLGHFYQKDGNQVGLVAMDNLILNYLVERFPAKE
jgi:hypothetical protein